MILEDKKHIQIISIEVKQKGDRSFIPLVYLFLTDPMTWVESDRNTAMNNINLEQKEQTAEKKEMNKEDDTNTGEEMLMEQMNNLKKELRTLKKNLQTTRLKNDHIKRKITRLADRQAVRKNEYV